MVLIGQLLEEDFDVTIITQNVDDLHERAGSTNILHLHGELTQSSYGTGNRNFDTVCEPINIGYDDILYGDIDEKFHQQIRPDIVWFGEYPKCISKAYDVKS
jgi:NAD-dependent deacetylase